MHEKDEKDRVQYLSNTCSSSMKITAAGSVVSGLAATWLFNKHSDHEINLLEADYRSGVHAYLCPSSDP
ncbi:hypothetical protein FB446DRAFT_53151 [Lentinula raphanica]|nr:hypothetical protein FB446DRAFT_53151 [Lentinula raphanica]